MLKTVVLLSILWFFFQDFFDELTVKKKTAFIWKRNLLYHYKCLVTSITASLLNESINFLRKKQNLLTPNFWTVVYTWLLTTEQWRCFEIGGKLQRFFLAFPSQTSFNINSSHTAQRWSLYCIHVFEPVERFVWHFRLIIKSLLCH